MNAWRRLTPAKQRMAVAAVALVAYVLVLFIWGSTGSSGSHPRPMYVGDSSAADEAATGFTPLVVIGGGLLVLAVVMLLYTFATLLRARGPRFKDLETSEQERRREAGRLLKGDPDVS